MHDCACQSLRIQQGKLELLDQRLLPHEEHWIDADTVPAMTTAIQGLAVRGAPAIGVAAALCLGRLAERACPLSEFRHQAAALRAARPTAVNLARLVDAICARVDADGDLAAVPALAERFYAEDRALCRALGRHGAALVTPGAQLLTHCNTGGLATVGWGTAFAVFRQAQADGKRIHVWVDETRPLLQGARLTAWELARAGIDHTVICDNMAASLMAAGRVDAVFLGADRIAMNGDTANKVGTYALAVACRHHAIPFYVVAPRTTLDPDCPDGAGIPIEMRDPAEVRGYAGAAGAIAWADAQSPVFNPAFDVTPADLISGWVLDTGVCDHASVRAGALHELARTA
ncbi:MAG: S-methyl-5-thioribose-1-phosphate isomerase [Planctomycetota bacterium]